MQVGSTDYAATCDRLPPSNNPVTDVTSTVGFVSIDFSLFKKIGVDLVNRTSDATSAEQLVLVGNALLRRDKMSLSRCINSRTQKGIVRTSLLAVTIMGLSKSTCKPFPIPIPSLSLLSFNVLTLSC
jgi:hypothetical protein